MFASRVTKDVPLPSDPSVTVTIRKLSWLQRQDAQRVSQAASSKALVEMGGAAVLDEMRKMSALAGEAAPVNAGPADPFLTHDTLTVLICGVKAWSVDAPIDKETLSDLGPEDAEGLARAILDLSLPSATLEADRKNAD